MYIRALFIIALLVGTTVARAEDIVIGQVASLTNKFAKPNVSAVNTGFHIFFAGINSKGGINGRKVVLSVYDDDYNPAETAIQVKKAIANPKIVALFGTVGTATVGEIVKSKILTESGISLISPLSGVPAHLGAPNVFPIRSSYFDQLKQIVKHSANLNRKKAAFLHLDTPLAPEMKKVLETALAQDGRKLTGSIGIAPAPDPVQMKNTIQEAVEKMQANEPDTYVVFAPSALGPGLINEIREKRGQAVAIYGIAVPNHDEIIKVAGLKNASGVIIAQSIPLPNDSRLKIVKEYMRDLQKYAPSEKASSLMLEGYLGARILYEGLKRAGPNPTRPGLTAALDKMGKIDIGGFEVDYTPGSKSGSKSVDMTMISKTGYLIH